MSCVAGLFALLSGCAQRNTVTDVLAESARAVWASPQADPPTPALSPAHRYLRVDVAGRPPAYLALGAVDPGADGSVQVWYSALREVVRLKGGRIAGTAGLEVDWLRVGYPKGTPSASRMLTESIRLTRERDAMPGYRYGLNEQLLSEPWPGVPLFAPIGAQGAVDLQRLQWVRETVIGPNPAQLPDAWFGFVRRGDKPEWAYAYQCLSATLCLHMRPWPPLRSAS